ncbi:MAG: hypothetical protein J0I33_09175 [Microbacterium ginsengisoli]|uniref:hypothetical protein n=1 Tax=Microbacterium TaxID=33882 RepID=UPI0006FAA6D6|nr:MULTISPECIES: hypothetical protein [unclassified Microbacterium]KQS02617.1 hypothetical protein ASF93_10150 [Microbacterium sp. Leaf347]KQS05991.1 hypothetical protein ASG00_00225 [Microbacterium sp. Leaf351]MBN9198797.1 hypothetical protein [Microbacterium ginsengisoli]
MSGERAGAPEDRSAATAGGAWPLPAHGADAVEPPSPDVVTPPASAALPGAHRGGFSRELTAPVDVAALQPVHEQTVFDVPAPAPAVRHPVPLSALGLGTAIIALGASLVVGWMLPLGVLAVGFGIAARRRPSPGRAMAIWAIALGAGSILYSAAWLTWAVVASGSLG